MDDLTLDQWISISVGVTSLLVAGATFFLAWKTRDMARETRDVAKATADEAEKVATQTRAAEQQIELSRSALDASIRPWLTKPIVDYSRVVPIWVGPWTTKSETTIVRVIVRNVGPGIALTQSGPEFRVEGPGPGGTTVTRYGFAASSALPPNEETEVSFVLTNVDLRTFLGQDRHDGEFYVWIPYSDVNGGQRVEARFHMTLDKKHSRWLYHKIDYFDGAPEEPPFATVVFDAAVQSELP